VILFHIAAEDVTECPAEESKMAEKYPWGKNVEGLAPGSVKVVILSLLYFKASYVCN